MAAARTGIGMRAPGSEQGRRGTNRVMLANRVHEGMCQLFFKVETMTVFTQIE